MSNLQHHQHQQLHQQQTNNINSDALFFVPPPFPGRGGGSDHQQQQQQCSVEAAAAAALQFQHAFSSSHVVHNKHDEEQQQQQTPHHVENQKHHDDGSATASFLYLQLHQQRATSPPANDASVPPLPLHDPLSVTASATAILTVRSHTRHSGNHDPLATLVAVSTLQPSPEWATTDSSTTPPSHDNTNADSTAASSTPLPLHEENDQLKRELVQRDLQIQSLRKQLEQQQSSLQFQPPLRLPNARTDNSASDAAVLAFVSSGKASAADPNAIKNLQERWRARFQQLIRYKLQYGHACVSKADDGPLHAWVRKQRTNKQLRDRTQGAKGLSLEQVDALDSIGFDWVVGVGKRPHVKHDLWQANYDKLVQYRNEHGSLPVTVSTDKALIKWMQNQRGRKKLLQDHGPSKAKGMTWERVHRLELLGFSWSTKDRLR